MATCYTFLGIILHLVAILVGCDEKRFLDFARNDRREGSK